MKKENRKKAQALRAEQRKREAARKKRNKILAIAIPVILIVLLVTALIVDAFRTTDTDTSEEATEITETEIEATDGDASDADATDADATGMDGEGTAYNTDSSLEVEDGDTVNIDYVGSIDGVEFDGGSYEGYDLVIGSGTFIDDFEEQLIGAHPGDTVDVTVTFPDNYSAEDLQGQEALFEVVINGIYEDE